MRTKAEIRADPQASEAELEHLASTDPVSALQHPNCTKDLWHWLMCDHGWAGFFSPAHPLFVLEDPAMWEAMKIGYSPKWMAAYWKKLPPLTAQAWAADCLEHILQVYPEHKKAKQITEDIQTRRNRATGRIKPHQGKGASIDPWSVIYDATMPVIPPAHWRRHHDEAWGAICAWCWDRWWQYYQQDPLWHLQGEP